MRNWRTEAAAASSVPAVLWVLLVENILLRLPLTSSFVNLKVLLRPANGATASRRNLFLVKFLDLFDCRETLRFRNQSGRLGFCFRPVLMEQPDDASTNTSNDDKTEDFGDNPTRDTLADGLLSLLRPTVEQLDERVKATRISQVELQQNLDSLSEDLKNVAVQLTNPLDLEKYIQKLTDTKAKITVVGNVLQSSQDRLIKLTQHITKEQNRRKALIEPSTSITQSATLLEPTSPSS